MKLTLEIAHDADLTLFEYPKNKAGQYTDAPPYTYDLQVSDLEVIDIVLPGTFAIPTGSVYCVASDLTQDEYDHLTHIEWVHSVYAEDF